MAKKSIIMLVILLLAVVAVSILFFSPCGITVEKFQVGVAPAALPQTSIAPVAADCTPGGNTYGYPNSDNTLRVYAAPGCKALGGILQPNGECMRQGGGSFSWDCRGLNPVPAAAQCNALYPPPPPPPPTLAQCSAQFSCQTTLAPIGKPIIMPSKSTPAPVA